MVPWEVKRMKRAKLILTLLLAAAALFFVCAELPMRAGRDDPGSAALPPSVGIRYRDADRILLATCMRISQTEGAPARARFTVDEVFEGEASVGSAITVAAEAEPGKQYLLYLRTRTDPETGGSAGTELVPGSPITVSDGVAECDGAEFTLESLRRDVARQRRILTVPAEEYYYADLDSLIAACDEIVVARVLSVSEPQETLCRSAGKGESTLSTLEEVFVSVSVENGLSGERESGEKLSIVLEPNFVRPVINAQDLSAKTSAAPPETALRVGSAYVFFLKKSEDPKSARYFTVNPYEGCVLLAGSTVVRPYYNEAMARVNDVAALARLIAEHE